MKVFLSVFWMLLIIAIFVLQWKVFMISYKQESENLDGEFRLFPEKKSKNPTKSDQQRKELNQIISILFAIIVLSFAACTYINLTSPYNP